MELPPLALAVAADADESSDMKRLADALTLAGHAVSWMAADDLLRAKAEFVLVNLGTRPAARIGSLSNVDAGRLVLVGVDRAAIPDLLRQVAPAAIIEYDAWRRWLKQSKAPADLVGLRSAGAGYNIFMEIGVKDYAVFDGGQLDLPGLMGDYLTRLKARRVL